MSKRKPNDDLLKHGNVSKRFNLSSKRAKGNIAKDRFAFDQTLQGHEAKKFVRAEILLFRNVIFSETKLASPQFLRLRQETRRFLRHNKKGGVNWEEAVTKSLGNSYLYWIKLLCYAGSSVTSIAHSSRFGSLRFSGAIVRFGIVVRPDS